MNITQEGEEQAKIKEDKTFYEKIKENRQYYNRKDFSIKWMKNVLKEFYKNQNNKNEH